VEEADEAAVATEADAVVEATDAPTIPTIPRNYFITVGHMVARATAVQNAAILLKTINGEQLLKT
jgi:hypothetical protein